jgi:hypothetical protein
MMPAVAHSTWLVGARCLPRLGRGRVDKREVERKVCGPINLDQAAPVTTSPKGIE